MNKQLQEFARSTLKLGLAKLDAKQVMLFKRMYSHNDLLKNISDVVDDMPDESLDWAMQQVQRSLEK